MINIQRFACNMLRENTYIVSDETKECVIIDCGAFYEEEKQAIKKYIEKNQLIPKHLVATHGHIDHNIGNKFIFDTYGLKVEVHKDDEKLMQMLPEMAQQLCNVTLDYEFPPIGKFLTGENTINFGNHTFTLFETPGHSQGCIMLYCKEENVLFTGDTLFKGSIGRTDFIGGSMFQIIQSLRMISQLPDETIVLPGHGEQTTMGYEQTTNPYLDR